MTRGKDRSAAPRKGERGSARVALLGMTAGASAAVAGLLVTAGLSLVLWAVTPSLSDPGALLRGAVVAFAAGSGADVSIGDAVLTLPPLLIGLLGWILLWQAVGRSPALPTTPARAVVLAP